MLLLTTTLLSFLVLQIGADAAYECGQPVYPPSFSRTPSSSQSKYGFDTKVETLPWLLRIHASLDDGKKMCAGSLLPHRSNYSEYVLTSARCLRDMHEFAGTFNIYVMPINPKRGCVRFLVRNYITTFTYSGKALGDLALLRVEPVPYNDIMSPICLPDKPIDVKQLKPEVCFAAGWGTEETGKFGVLKMVELDLNPKAPCTNESDKYICATESVQGHGVCEGDTGSPLVCKLDGKYVALGILSEGRKSCISSDEVSLRFTRLDALSEWIEDSKIAMESARPQKSIYWNQPELYREDVKFISSLSIFKKRDPGYD